MFYASVQTQLPAHQLHQNHQQATQNGQQRFSTTITINTNLITTSSSPASSTHAKESFVIDYPLFSIHHHTTPAPERILSQSLWLYFPS